MSENGTAGGEVIPLLSNIYSRTDLHPVYHEGRSPAEVSFAFDAEAFHPFAGLNAHEAFLARHTLGANAPTRLTFPYATDFSEQGNVHIARFSKATAFLLFALRRYANDMLSCFDLTQRCGAEIGAETAWVFQVGDMTSDTPGSIAYQRRTSYRNVRLFPDEYFMTSLAYATFRDEVRRFHMPWAEREAKAFWRGSSTGLLNLTTATLDGLPRYRLCIISRAHPDLLDAGITDIVQAPGPQELTDLRDALLQQGMIREHVPQVSMIRYKYLVDIDGNANSWGLFNKLLMGSCVLKVASDWEEWYYPHLKPWQHYVPVAADMSDLAEKIVWCRDNDADAARIARNGMVFASRMTIDTEIRKVIGQMFSAPADEAIGQPV